MKLIDDKTISSYFKKYYPTQWKLNRDNWLISEYKEHIINFDIEWNYYEHYKDGVVRINETINWTPNQDPYNYNSHTSIQVDKYIYRNILDHIYHLEISGYNFNKDNIKAIKLVISTCEERGVEYVSPLTKEEKNPLIIKTPKKKIKRIKPIITYSDSKTYLIKDKTNNTYKIGKSKSPMNREKTLQSEKPNLEMVKTWSSDIETELHKKYKRQRLRGEWFNLTPIQVRYICTHY